MPRETMILTLGQPQGVEALPQLPGFQEGARAARMAPVRRGIVVTRVDPRARPAARPLVWL